MRDPFTPAEIEIAELLADGLSRLQIAERRICSPETVAAHLRNIRGKLDLHTQAQIAVFVARAQERGRWPDIVLRPCRHEQGPPSPRA